MFNEQETGEILRSKLVRDQAREQRPEDFKALVAEMQQKASGILSALGLTSRDEVIGPHSNAALANKIAKKQPEFYKILRFTAISDGVIGG